MKYPKSVLIKDTVYDIVFVKKMRHKTRSGGLGITYGICDPSEAKILISKGIGKKKTLETLIHELLHAFEAEYDVDIPHRLVYRLEKPILDFLINNSLI